MSFNLTLRKVYLYMFAIIGLILVIIGSVSFVNLGLKKFVFTKSDYPCYNTYIEKSIDGRESTTAEDQTKQCEEQRVSDKQRQASNALAQLIIGLPLYLYHWMVIKKENQV